MGSSLYDCIDSAIQSRESLITNPAITAYRVFNGQADGMPGLVIERLGDVLIAQLHEGVLACTEDEARRLVLHVHEKLGTRAVYRKFFVRDRSGISADLSRRHADPQPWIGDPVEAELVIEENGLKYLVYPYDGFSVGLFLEHRENRRRIRELSAGRCVLNTFSYTGGFSVAAAVGGAIHVASVDLSKRYLEWSKRNFEINEIDFSPHKFYKSDIFAFYKRAKRQGLRYSLIILDPPTFARAPRAKDVFVLAERLEELVTDAVDLLDPGGIVLLATNDRHIARTRLEDALVSAQVERAVKILERPDLPIDFAGDPGYSKTVIAQYD